MKIHISRLSAILFIFIITVSSAFCQDDSKYQLQPMDVLLITVHEQDDLTTRIRVTQDGYITFPLLGRIKVAGVTVQELEKTIKDLLEKDYLVSAEALVFIEEYHPRQVSVLGEVEKPGKFKMPEEKTMTVLEAIAMAGGFTEDALAEKTKIIRVKNGAKETININIKYITEKGQKDKDIVLEADDIVYVPESFF